MSTEKKRIQAYVKDGTIPKFKILTALKGYRSMSEYAGELIEKSISEYEAAHGEIVTQFRGGYEMTDNYTCSKLDLAQIVRIFITF